MVSAQLQPQTNNQDLSAACLHTYANTNKSVKTRLTECPGALKCQRVRRCRLVFKYLIFLLM